MRQMIKKRDRYNKLTAIEFSCRIKNKQYWLFKCDCGKEKVIQVGNVKNGHTKSCGCLFLNGNSSTHKMSNTRIYISWENMKQRCLNKNELAYKNYGARGITVCKKWLTFQNFYKDMGEMPENKTLDRINNNKGYCKKNCKWSTRKEQMNNVRYNRLLTYKGKTQTMKQWSEELEINYGTIFSRLKAGWSINKSLTNNYYGKLRK